MITAKVNDYRCARCCTADEPCNSCAREALADEATEAIERSAPE